MLICYAYGRFSLLERSFWRNVCLLSRNGNLSVVSELLLTKTKLLTNQIEISVLGLGVM